ncbi:MAG: hypothetical protein AAF497_26950, partial [Planctomycetota bacterium]
ASAESHMSTTSAIPFLRDFGSIAGGDTEGLAADSCAPVLGDADELALGEQEYERGVEEGRSQVEAEFNSQLEEFKEQASRELVEAREAWVSEQGNELSRQIKLEHETLYHDLSKAVAVALGPVLQRHVLAETVTRFSECVQEMANGTSSQLCLAGPEDLANAVKAQLQGTFDNVEVSIKETPELSVRVDDTTVSTNLTKWTQAIEETIS